MTIESAERTAMPSHPTQEYPGFVEHLPDTHLVSGAYEARFARTPDELDEVLRLRFEVFNLELAEGLRESYTSGRDEDPFDAVCHHLIVVERASGAIVGTYRMQTYDMAAATEGLYTATEFDLSAWPGSVLDASVELGRACIAQAHRSLPVLNLLWQGIGAYLAANDKRYVFGCCSLTSQDPAEGLRVYKYLEQKNVLHPALVTAPQPGYACETDTPVAPGTIGDVPRLMRVYLNTGALICGPPAIDRAFKTIDFLAFFDAETLDTGMAKFFRYQR